MRKWLQLKQPTSFERLRCRKRAVGVGRALVVLSFCMALMYGFYSLKAAYMQAQPKSCCMRHQRMAQKSGRQILAI